MGPSSSMGRPSTSTTRPSTASPTGTRMLCPVFFTWVPQRMPSVASSAMQRTTPGDALAATSICLPSALMSKSRHPGRLALKLHVKHRASDFDNHALAVCAHSLHVTPLGQRKCCACDFGNFLA